MMIRPEEIPDEVAIIADEAYYDTPLTMPDHMIMKTAIAAALNKWLDMECKGKYTVVTLPLDYMT
jgi:hypothetical protein